MSWPPTPAASIRLSAQLLLVALLVVLVYRAGLGGGFVFDDYPNIVANTRLHITGLAWSDWLAAAASSPAADLPRPLAMASFAANHAFTGLDPWPMKLTNVLIHALNAALAVWLCRDLVALLPGGTSGARKWLPLMTGLAWALHPINLTAVLLVVQRMEVLSHTFVLLGLLLYLAGRRAQMAGRRGWGLIAGGLVACTAVGVMSKESAVLLPLYALILEWAFLDFRAADPSTTRRLKGLFLFLLLVPAAVGLYWLIPRTLAEGAYAGRDFTLVERLLTEARVVATYARWILAPDLGQMSLSHDDFVISRGLFRPVSTLLAVAGIPAYIAFAVWLRRRQPLITLGMAWFLAAHLLTATIIPLELVFEHRNYFASLGMLVALFGSLTSFADPSRARMGLLVASLLVLFYGSSTLVRASEWGNPLSLSRTEAIKRPLSPRATYDWGRTLVVAGGYDPDSPLTREAFIALERARSVPGSTILPSQALIILASRTGRRTDSAWWDDMAAKLADRPIGPQERGAMASLVECANTGACQLPQGQMVRVFDAALSRGDDAEILNLYASYAWNQWQDAEFSRAMWSRSIELNPNEAQYRINLAGLLIAVGKWDEAHDQIRGLRSIGRLGQHEAAASRLERRLTEAARASAPSPTPAR